MYSYVWWPINIAFEVKIEIDSAPELLQQVKYYQQFLEPETPFVVVSPDTRYRDIIESQGILFYEPYAKPTLVSSNDLES